MTRAQNAPLRLVLTRFVHETNSFSPIPTPLAAFEPLWGGAALTKAEGFPTPIGAFFAFAKRIGADIRVPVFAQASPSAPVDDDAFETISAAILAEIKQGCDAVLLDLHGAMVTRSYGDAEGELLARIRALAPHTPLGVALDLHANLTQRMLDSCDVLLGFRTFPHIDMVETGERLTRLMEPLLRKESKPTMALCHPPILAATLRMNTAIPGAMADILAMARSAETQAGIHAVSIFGGFPIADMAEAGLSVVVIAETADLAHKTARWLGNEAWQRRADFVYDEEPLEHSLCRAATLSGKGKPVLLLDHGDNCISGGSCDVMDVIEALMRAKHSGILVGPIADFEAVAALIAAGIGAQVNLSLGNKLKAQGLPAPRAPLSIRGRVHAISDGCYQVTGPIFHGQTLSMGRAVALETEQAMIVVCERPHEPLDLGIFTCLGLNVPDYRFLVLKSRMYCRPVFEPITAATVECASSGVTTSKSALFPFAKLTRPIYPLDLDMRWQAD